MNKNKWRKLILCQENSRFCCVMLLKNLNFASDL